MILFSRIGDGCTEFSKFSFSVSGCTTCMLFRIVFVSCIPFFCLHPGNLHVAVVKAKGQLKLSIWIVVILQIKNIFLERTHPSHWLVCLSKKKMPCQTSILSKVNYFPGDGSAQKARADDACTTEGWNSHLRIDRPANSQCVSARTILHPRGKNIWAEKLLSSTVEFYQGDWLVAGGGNIKKKRVFLFREEQGGGNTSFVTAKRSCNIMR